MPTPGLYLTEDGSHSLRSERFGASYHSSHGAIQESRHIFLRAGVDHLLPTLPGATLRILELGFGTGLNALLVRTLAAARPELSVYYLTFEQYPLAPAVAAGLNYPKLLGCPPADLRELHTCDWGVRHALTDNFTFCKRREDFLTAKPEDKAFDLIFYDAFAPEDQPELWTVEAMQQCRGCLRTGGALVTYCAKGQFKRNLRAAGFRVEALPGPVGKREMTRGIATGV